MVETIRNKFPTESINLEPYPTLRHQKKGILVAVKEIRIIQDCFDIIRLAVPSKDHRNLTREHVIELVFIGERDIPFYTLLSYDGGSKEYYTARIGEIFKIKTEDN